MDRELNHLRKQDAWLVFLNQDPRGVLIQLMKKAKSWRDQQPQTMPTRPLRCVLAMELFTELHTRATNIANLPATDLLKVALKTKQVLSAEEHWNYMQWNPSAHKLEVASRPPLTMPMALTNLEGLTELMTSDHVVTRFFSLKQKPDMTDVPWILTVSLRNDDIWKILSLLANNAISTIIGATSKGHSHHQSRQTQALLDLVHPTSRTSPSKKGKGQRPPATPQSKAP